MVHWITALRKASGDAVWFAPGTGSWRTSFRLGVLGRHCAERATCCWSPANYQLQAGSTGKMFAFHAGEVAVKVKVRQTASSSSSTAETWQQLLADATRA